MVQIAQILAFVVAMATTNVFADYKDGTLFVIKNGNRTVQLVTKSPYTHMAVIFKEDGKYYVYESAYKKGVRKVRLNDYMNLVKAEADERCLSMYVMQPKIRWTPSQRKKMLDYLHSQLGRRYSVRSYIKGRPMKGIHCSELIANMFSKAGIELNIDKSNPRITPADMVRVLPGWMYEKIEVVVKPS